MLMFLTTIIVVISVVIVKFILPILKRYFQLKREYQDITILPTIPFLGNIHQLNGAPHHLYQLVIRLSKACQYQNKGLYCIWYLLWPMVVICSGDGLETFINSSKQLVKSAEYKFVEPWLKTGLVTSNHEKWRSRRRLITPSFHDTQLLYNFMSIFYEQSCILVRRLDEFAKQSSKACELYSYVSVCTLDIIAEAATGTNPNAQGGEEKNEFVEATDRIGDIINWRVRSPWLWPDFIFNMLPIGREQKRVLNVLHGFSRKIIEERLATFNVEEATNSDDKKSTRRLVFLDSLLAHMHKEKLTLDDIQEQVDTFMFAGHDTTSLAVTFFCYLVGCYPEVQAKVHAEMDSIFGDDRKRECTMEDIQKMTYLDCVIKECMRVLPSVPAIGREAQEDFVYRGQTIRKGTAVVVYIYGIHHDASVYPDPEKFDPERFAEHSSTSNERSPFTFIPFSAGSRNCIGQRFAALEERVLLSTLFRHFSFHSTQTIDELHLSGDLVLRCRVPIKIFIKRR